MHHIVIMTTHSYNQMKLFKILINEAFNIFYDGDFHCF